MKRLRVVCDRGILRAVILANMHDLFAQYQDCITVSGHMGVR